MKPEYGGGRLHNDYGRGFHCTESEELAKEWACSSLSDGISNHYRLDETKLRLMNLNSSEYNILNWMAVLVTNRLFRLSAPIAAKSRKYLEDNFLVNVNAYDIIIGYRADDRYYDFADAFLNNTITVEQLARAMKLGKLGEQVVLKSKYAFECLEFIDSSLADKEIYYPKRIMRKGIRNDDARIPRNISE